MKEAGGLGCLLAAGMISRNQRQSDSERVRVCSGQTDTKFYGLLTKKAPQRLSLLCGALPSAKCICGATARMQSFNIHILPARWIC